MSGEGKIGIIGGSGLYNLEGVEIVKEHRVVTPFGAPSGDIIETSIKGHSAFFLSRHGKGHHISPSEINYRANIYALKKLGVEYLVSVSAVGSLKEELSPRMIFLPTQFIDWTKGQRKRSFFENGVVGHVSVANPIELSLQQLISSVCDDLKIKYGKDGSYICIEGPQFSTKAESEIYRSFGASVIGMTNVPESYLAKEAGMAYATVALVTDYDCWKEEHCTLEEIMKVMGDNYKTAHKILLELIPRIDKEKPRFNKENQTAVVTNPELFSEDYKEIIRVLVD